MAVGGAAAHSHGREIIFPRPCGPPGRAPPWAAAQLGIFDSMEAVARLVSAGNDGAACGYPFLTTAVEVPDPEHALRVLNSDEKNALSGRIASVARDAGVADPEHLGEQLALLYDGAAARSVALNSPDTLDTAREIACVLVDQALPRTGG